MFFVVCGLGQAPQQFVNVQPNQIAPQQPGGTINQTGAAVAYSMVNTRQIQNRPQVVQDI